MRFPERLTRFFPNYLHVLVIFAAFLVCAFLYDTRALHGLMSAGEGRVLVGRDIFSFNVAICAAIVFVSMNMMRLPLFFLRRPLEMTLGGYVVWCFGEVLLCSFFVALYLTLMSGDGLYFEYLGRTFAVLLSLFVWPYVILTLWFCLRDARETDPVSEGERLRFYDSRHQLRFITGASTLLFIEASENYVIIHYLDNGTEKQYQLRNTMKSVEPLCEKAGLVRSHRSFFINPAHIRQIRKDPQSGQFFADLGVDRDGGIPVSRKYYDNVTAVM